MTQLAERYFLDNPSPRLEHLLEETINPEILTNFANDPSEDIKIQAWILILAKHKELNAAELKEIATRLNISANDQVKFALIFASLDFVDAEAGLKNKDKYAEKFTLILEEYTKTRLLPKEYSSHIAAYLVE